MQGTLSLHGGQPLIDQTHRNVCSFRQLLDPLPDQDCRAPLTSVHAERKPDDDLDGFPLPSQS